jgi:hypothetical protein
MPYSAKLWEDDMKKLFFVLFILSALFGIDQRPSPARDWNEIADKLVAHFEGRIISVEELNTMNCRVKLSPRLSHQQAVKIAENIGLYILKLTRRERSGETPNIYVCIGEKQIATAKVARRQYVGKLDIKDCE